MPRQNGKIADIASLRKQLISWYDENKRDLPWRTGEDPYAIWVSEIMLQQTRVAVVVDRYQAFMQRFPSLGALARAEEQDVLAMWSGLGYYRRARMLHKAAQFVTDNLNGILPLTSTELRKLPGIGAYTSAAIASIAYGEPVAVVDGNVERVLCRLAGWGEGGRTSASALRKKIEERAAQSAMPCMPCLRALPNARRTQNQAAAAHVEPRSGARTLREDVYETRQSTRYFRQRNSAGAASGHRDRNARHVGTAKVAPRDCS